MGELVKLATIQPRLPDFLPEYNPFNGRFDPDAVCKGYFEQNLEGSIALLGRAGEAGAHFACTPEDIRGAGKFINFVDNPDLFTAGTDRVPGEATERIGAVAKEFQMYVVASLYEHADGAIFNTGVLIDPYGRVAGKYRKVQLAAQERFRVDAGGELPVFETSFGLVGILVCYDLWFPEISRILALKGARILFNPTEGFAWSEDIGICKLRVRAEENQLNLVVARKAAAWDRPGRSCIINQWGHIVADAGYQADAVVTGEVSLAPKEQPEVHHVTLYSGIRDMRTYYFLERRPEIYAYLTESSPRIFDQFSGARLIQRSERDRIRLATRRLYGAIP